MEPVSIKPEVLTPPITISPLFDDPTNLLNRSVFVTEDTPGPSTELEITSSVCPTTEEVTRLKD